MRFYCNLQLFTDNFHRMQCTLIVKEYFIFGDETLYKVYISANFSHSLPIDIKNIVKSFPTPEDIETKMINKQKYDMGYIFILPVKKEFWNVTFKISVT